MKYHEVEFMDLTYMLEEYVPLSEPHTYPMYVINEFPGMKFLRSSDILYLFSLMMFFSILIFFHYFRDAV